MEVPPEVDPKLAGDVLHIAKGEKSLTAKDHYDLGVAYMGMGLVDAAVREFNQAKPKHAGEEDNEPARKPRLPKRVPVSKAALRAAKAKKATKAKKASKATKATKKAKATTPAKTRGTAKTKAKSAGKAKTSGRAKSMGRGGKGAKSTKKGRR
jgi:valyl-tRNA synthetase